MACYIAYSISVFLKRSSLWVWETACYIAYSISGFLKRSSVGTPFCGRGKRFLQPTRSRGSSNNRLRHLPSVVGKEDIPTRSQGSWKDRRQDLPKICTQSEGSAKDCRRDLLTNVKENVHSTQCSAKDHREDFQNNVKENMCFQGSAKDCRQNLPTNAKRKMITLDLRVLYFFILEAGNKVSFDFIPHPVHVKGSFQYTIKLHLPPVAWLTCHLSVKMYRVTTHSNITPAGAYFILSLHCPLSLLYDTLPSRTTSRKISYLNVIKTYISLPVCPACIVNGTQITYIHLSRLSGIAHPCMIYASH